jgi:predicted ATPase
MRITRLSARGLLSFEDLELTFEHRRTVIVGPNGSGKSNVGRLIELVVRALQAADNDSAQLRDMLDSYLAGMRANARTTGIEVRMGFELTTEHEKELMAAFIRAAVVASTPGNFVGADLASLDNWATTQVTAARLTPLFVAEVVVTHSGAEDARWQVGVEFNVPDRRRRPRTFRWVVMGDNPEQIVAVEDIDRQGLFVGQLQERLQKAAKAHATPRAPSGAFSMARLVPRKGTAVTVSLRLTGNPPPPTIRHFADLLGVNPLGVSNTSRSINLARVLGIAIRQSLVQTSDQRLLPVSGFSWNAQEGGLRAGAEANLPEMLFLLKNGGSSGVERFSKIQRLFKEFTQGRELDLLVQQVSVGDENPAQGLHVHPRPLVSVAPVDDDTEVVGQVPIEFAGAGAWEALVLACILGSQAQSIAFLDEPAVALSPTLQRLLESYLAASDGQLIMVTHSPYLLPLEDTGGDAVLIRIDRDEQMASRLWKVHPDLLRSVAPKLRAKGNERLPYSWRTVLCEGQFDVIVVRAIAELLHIDLDGRNISIIDCGGRSNLPDYIILAGQLGIPTLVVADADSTKASAKPEVKKQVDSVRNTVTAEIMARLVEFPEDPETTFKVPKVADALEKAAQSVDLTNPPQEVADLANGLQDLASPTRY